MQAVDLSNYVRVEPSQQPIISAVAQQFPPNPNPMLRCPLPPIGAGPDSLRQFYVNGSVPQTRIMPAPSLV